MKPQAQEPLKIYKTKYLKFKLNSPKAV